MTIFNSPEMAAKNKKNIYLWNHERQHWNSNGKSRVYDHRELEKMSASDCDNDRQPEIACACQNRK